MEPSKATLLLNNPAAIGSGMALSLIRRFREEPCKATLFLMSPAAIGSGMALFWLIRRFRETPDKQAHT